MRSPSPRAALLTILLVPACSAAPTPPPASVDAPPPAPPAVSAPVAAAPTSPPAPAKPDVLAKDSSPPGVQKLTEEEREGAAKSCAPLAEAMAAAATQRKLVAPADRVAFVELFLARPPTLPGVDVARCADLLLRDTRAYIAAMIETEAHMNIARIATMLVSAADRDPPQICPSAGPVPASQDAFAAGAWQSKPDDWAAPGFRCAHFDLAGEPQRFQYQIVTNAAAGTWEVIARGTPVKGAAPTELYARGKLGGGQPRGKIDIYRRTSSR